MKIDIKITGADRVKSLLGTVAAAALRTQGPIISLSSDAPYARFIEEGRSSRQVRRAGPARMFRDGIAAMRPRIGPALGPAILKGPAAVDRAKADLNRQAVEEVRRRTPVRTGALRASVRESRRPQ